MEIADGAGAKQSLGEGYAVKLALDQGPGGAASIKRPFAWTDITAPDQPLRDERDDIEEFF